MVIRTSTQGQQQEEETDKREEEGGRGRGGGEGEKEKKKTKNHRNIKTSIHLANTVQASYYSPFINYYFTPGNLLQL